MALADLTLTKKEIPVLEKGLFQMPIHHGLLDSNLSLDPGIVARVFPLAAKEWYQDLTNYIKSDESFLGDKERIKEVFLRVEPKVVDHMGGQIVEHLFWENINMVMENGFVNHLSIGRNTGGSLYYNSGDSNCETRMSSKPYVYIKMNREKAREFAFGERDSISKLHIYSSHNIDDYPEGLFLRNWSLLYLNEAMQALNNSF